MTLPQWQLTKISTGQWLVALAAIALVSWGAGFFHNWPPLAALGAGLLVYAAARRLSSGERGLLLMLAGGAAALGMVAVWLLAGERNPYPASAINPNALAAIILLALPSLPLLGIGLFLTGSRAALGAGLVWVLADMRAMFSRRVFVGALVVAVGLVAAMLVARPETIAARVAVWQEAARLVERHPVWGVGYGNYAHYAHVERGKIHADSLPITFLAEMGLVGGGAALAIVAAIARRVVVGRAAPAIKWGLLLFALQSLVDHPAANVIVLPVLMIALAEVEA